MAQHADASGSLALSRRPRSDARALPKTTHGRRALGAASVSTRPVQPAEVAQARVFEGLLQAECTELRELAHRIAAGVHQQPDSDSSQPPRDLHQIHARIDEVHGLLQALQGRFPHSTPNVDH
jgi:hypothetical protein